MVALRAASGQADASGHSTFVASGRFILAGLSDKVRRQCQRECTKLGRVGSRRRPIPAWRLSPLRYPSIAVSIRYDIAGSIAHCRMLGRQRIIPRGGGPPHRPRAGSRSVRDRRRGFPIATERRGHPHGDRAALDREDRRLRRKAAHARSRNDQVATDLRLYLKEQSAVRTRTAGPDRSPGAAGARAARRGHARLYAPAAGTAGVVRAPPSGLHRDDRARSRALRGLLRARRRAAPGLGGVGRHHLPHRPTTLPSSSASAR